MVFVTVTAFDITTIQYKDQYLDDGGSHYDQDSLYMPTGTLLLKGRNYYHVTSDQGNLGVGPVFIDKHAQS